MTREEFLGKANKELDMIFSGKRNHLMNLFQQAWAEGKKNAEVTLLMEAIEEAENRKNRLAPTIVTCKECKHYLPAYETAACECFCDKLVDANGFLADDFFCALGDRKENANGQD